jgi:hypothetical protein
MKLFPENENWRRGVAVSVFVKAMGERGLRNARWCNISLKLAFLLTLLFLGSMNL